MSTREELCMDEYSQLTACGRPGSSWFGDAVNSILGFALLAVAALIVLLAFLFLSDMLALQTPSARRQRRAFVDSSGEVARLQSDIDALSHLHKSVKAAAVGIKRREDALKNLDLQHRYKARIALLRTRSMRLRSGLPVTAHLPAETLPPWRLPPRPDVDP